MSSAPSCACSTYTSATVECPTPPSRLARATISLPPSVSYIMDYHRDNVELSFLRNFDAHLQDHPTQYELTLINWKAVLAITAAVEDGEGYTKPFCLLERRMGTNGAKRGAQLTNLISLFPCLCGRDGLIYYSRALVSLPLFCDLMGKKSSQRAGGIFHARGRGRVRTQDCGER